MIDTPALLVENVLGWASASHFKEKDMKSITCVAALFLILISSAGAGLIDSLKAGPADIKQAGPLAFGPDGILFIGDTQQGAIYAIATNDTSGDPESAKIDVKGIDQQIAAMLGTTPADILINDLAT